jgi:hypothetical protein
MNIDEFLDNLPCEENLNGIELYQVQKRLETRIKADIQTLAIVKGMRQKKIVKKNLSSRDDKAKQRLQELIMESIKVSNGARKTVKDFIEFKPFHEGASNILKTEFGINIHALDVQEWIIKLTEEVQE